MYFLKPCAAVSMVCGVSSCPNSSVSSDCRRFLHNFVSIHCPSIAIGHIYTFLFKTLMHCRLPETSVVLIGACSHPSIDLPTTTPAHHLLGCSLAFRCSCIKNCCTAALPGAVFHNRRFFRPYNAVILFIEFGKSLSIDMTRHCTIRTISESEGHEMYFDG